jgi:hypothetical protein
MSRELQKNESPEHTDQKTREDGRMEERRRFLVNAGKLVYVPPTLALLYSTAEALDPPNPPDSSLLAP